MHCRSAENSLTTCSRVLPSGGSRVPTVITIGEIWGERRGAGKRKERVEGKEGKEEDKMNE